MTPAEIGKLTEHAKHAKALMQQSSAAAEKAGPILASYERTLGAFNANLDRVSKEDAGLQAAMAAMGNAGPVLEAAFSDGEAKAVDARPEETAQLATVNGKAD